MPLPWKAAASFGAPVLLGLAICVAGTRSRAEWPSGSWPRHTIDDSSQGADGVRLADLDGDGLLDIATPWEQGGQVRAYLNPGRAGLHLPWPTVTVGAVGDPEDAFFVDLDGDSALDVVSLCEGTTRSIFVHWSPPDRSELLVSQAWRTAALPASSGLARWMFGVALQVDGRWGIDLVAASKGDGAQLGWFEAPSDPRDLAAWRWHPLYDAGWIMTIRTHDMDGDGLLDLVATDRHGSGRGAFWLRNPGPGKAAAGPWAEHRIGPADDHEAMHHAIADLDGDGLDDLLVAVKGGPLRYHRRSGNSPPTWSTHLIEMPPGAGTGKSVQAADIDLDGQMDLVVACEHATDGKIGVFWLSYAEDPTESNWAPTSVSGPEGFIYDLIELTDLDGDGDLDIVTLEEKGPYLAAGYRGKELGVIWYENPAR